MDRIVINGGKPLHGEVKISGAKNATLPIMVASILSSGTTILHNVPNLRDISSMAKLLRILGAEITKSNHDLTLHTSDVSGVEAPYDVVKTMRASFYVLGPLVARFGKARVSLPGGCAWGPRPVDLHIKGIQALGANIEIDQGYVIASAPRLHGAKIVFEISSVGATGNVLMAAVLAKGTTVIENAALEPEIEALAHFLVKMGARIHGIGTRRLEIEGVDELHPAEETMIPDRIEAGTFLVACGMAGGEITLHGMIPKIFDAVLEKAKQAGMSISEEGDRIKIKSDGRPNPVSIKTAPYPGFPTDMQAQWMAWMCLAKGDCTITDTVYHDRFTHVGELHRLGALITMEGNTAIIHGIEMLKGAPVMSTDIRASACLILAGLAAKGQTKISRVYHIDRGFERIEQKLSNLGADIWREADQ